MKLKELMIKSNDRIRRNTWPKDQFLIVSNPMAYWGTEIGFTPQAYSPDGMLYHSKGRVPFWCFPNDNDDWEIV